MEKLQRGPGWDPTRMDDEVLSLLACPIVAKTTTDGTGGRPVVAVLFADSTDVDVFDDSRVREVLTACRGLAEYVEALVAQPKRELLSIPAEVTAFRAPTLAADQELLLGLEVVTALDMPLPEIACDYLNLEWNE